jgi:predicted DsbA family dithiol-disulfide isomerase
VREVPSVTCYQLEKKAISLGLPFTERKTTSDSRLATELAKWAETKETAEAYYETIYRAYFGDGLNIADRAVLLDVAGTAGLPREEARSVLEQRSFSQAVDDDWKKSEECEIMVAPTYIINQDRLAGSQPYGRLEKLLQRNGTKRKFEE